MSINIKECPYPELTEAMEWYRWMLDQYDPDHHINFHFIKSGGKDKYKFGYVRVELKPVGIRKEFILASPTRAALNATVLKARRFRDTIPTDIMMTKRDSKESFLIPTYPGVRYREEAYRHCWVAYLGENHRPKHQEFRIKEHGHLGALKKAIALRKDIIHKTLTEQKPRLIIEKYAHLFDS